MIKKYQTPKELIEHPYRPINPIKLYSKFQKLTLPHAAMPIEDNSKQSKRKDYAFFFCVEDSSNEVQISLKELLMFEQIIKKQIKKTQNSPIQKNWVDKKKKLTNILSEITNKNNYI